MSAAYEILWGAFLGYIIALLVCFRSPLIFLNLYYGIVPIVIFVGILLLLRHIDKGKRISINDKERINK